MGAKLSHDKEELWNLKDWKTFRVNQLSLINGLEGKALEAKGDLEETIEKIKKEWKEPPRPQVQDLTEGLWKERVKSITRLREKWAKITPQQFVICVNMLGKDVADYLTLLSVPINYKDWWRVPVLQENGVIEKVEWKSMKWLQRSRYDQAETLNVMPANFPEDHETENIRWDRRKTGCYLLRKPQVKMSIHWTGVTRLIQPKSVHDQVRIIQALFYCGMDSECFNTVVSKCILNNAWNRVKTDHRVILVLDFVFLLLLAANSACMIYFSKGPPEWIIYPTYFFIIRAFWMTMVMFITHVWELGKMDGFYAVITKWNIAMLIVEVTNAINLGSLFFWGEKTVQPNGLCDPRNHDKTDQQCPLVLHPVKYALAIGLKWIHFIFELLNTDGLGHSVLPAFKAVTGTDALAFMVFLMIVVFGTVQTYWALPIAEHLPKEGRSVFALVFMKVFRLELLGDFDIAELEGEDPQINGTWKNNTLTGNIVDATESPLFHDAVMIIVLFASVVVTVLSMNVAIGVVSTAYSTNKANSNQLYCHYQAGYVFKLLLRHAVAARVFGKCCIKEEDIEEEGYFVGFDERWFMDSNDLDEEFDVLQSTIEQNRHKLDRIDQMLDDSADRADTKAASKHRRKIKNRR